MKEQLTANPYLLGSGWAVAIHAAPAPGRWHYPYGSRHQHDWYRLRQVVLPGGGFIDRHRCACGCTVDAYAFADTPGGHHLAQATHGKDPVALFSLFTGLILDNGTLAARLNELNALHDTAVDWMLELQSQYGHLMRRRDKGALDVDVATAQVDASIQEGEHHGD